MASSVPTKRSPSEDIEESPAKSIKVRAGSEAEEDEEDDLTSIATTEDEVEIANEGEQNDEKCADESDGVQSVQGGGCSQENNDSASRMSDDRISIPKIAAMIAHAEPGELEQMIKNFIVKDRKLLEQSKDHKLQIRSLRNRLAAAEVAKNTTALELSELQHEKNQWEKGKNNDKKRLRGEIVNANRSFQEQEKQIIRNDYNQKLKDHDKKHKEAVEVLKAQHTRAIETLKASHKDTIASIKTEASKETSHAKQQKKDLGEERGRLKSEQQAAISKAREEAKALRPEHSQVVKDKDAQLKDCKKQIGRLERTVEDMKSSSTQLEKQIARLAHLQPKNDELEMSNARYSQALSESGGVIQNLQLQIHQLHRDHEVSLREAINKYRKYVAEKDQANQRVLEHQHTAFLLKKANEALSYRFGKLQVELVERKAELDELKGDGGHE